MFLVIEFLDELVYGVRETAWPWIRSDLNLSYAQIGLALSLPGVLGIFIEVFTGAAAESGRRRVLILGGGAAFVISLVVTGVSPNFVTLLLAFCLFSPASGAFVGLSQAALMDAEPGRQEQNMARWTFAGSLGVFFGPLLLSGLAWSGLGWRHLIGGLAVFAAAVLFVSWRTLPRGSEAAVAPQPLRVGLERALQALKRGEVLRWIILLEFSDLMLDVLYGYLALYLVDVVHLAPQTAALGVALWTGLGLLGDFLLIPLLERVRGLAYLRVSVLIELALFPAFLLVDWLPGKLAILALLGFFNAGWYSVLKGNLYTEIEGQTSTILVLDNAAALVGRLIPLGLGLAAERFGLGAAMWLLLAGPLALLVGLPRRQKLHS